MDWLETRTRVPTLGVVPMLPLPLPEEDAFSLKPTLSSDVSDKPRVAILKTPYLSNFDEFDALVHDERVYATFVHEVHALRKADAVILAGSKHVAADLAFLRRSGLAKEVAHLAELGVPVLGICGGFQMLGRTLKDPQEVESSSKSVAGLNLLNVETVMAADKVTRQTQITLLPTGEVLHGYEIHHGRTQAGTQVQPLLGENLGFSQGNVMGVYVHGLFDNTTFRRWFLAKLSAETSSQDWLAHVDTALDTLAAHLSESLDIDEIDKALDEPHTPFSP